MCIAAFSFDSENIVLVFHFWWEMKNYLLQSSLDLNLTGTKGLNVSNSNVVMYGWSQF